MPPTLAILTDFGITDPYVGIMKGVVAGIAPGTPVVDITHGVPPQDVLVGSLLLGSAVPWFPDGTIFLVVVDPGVGSSRRVVACRLGPWTFVCPDNGLLSDVLGRNALHGAVVASDQRFHLPNPSHTFHGRDIMAPVAAHLATGVDLEALGPPAGELQVLDIPSPRRELDMLVGEGLYVDHFGNIVTNILGRDLRPGVFVQVAEHRVPLVDTYAEVEPGSFLALVGSTGRLEISLNGGSASALLRAGQGAPVIVLFEES